MRTSLSYRASTAVQACSNREIMQQLLVRMLVTGQLPGTKGWEFSKERGHTLTRKIKARLGRDQSLTSETITKLRHS
jgi:hypothetical protein